MPIRPSFKHVLRPGKALMLLLSMRAKLALVALCVMLPLSSLVVWWALNKHASIQVLRDKRAGLEVAERLAELSQEVQKHRTLTHRMLAGDSAAGPQRTDVQMALQRATQQLESALADHGAPRVQTAWKEQAPKLQSLHATPTPGQSAAALAAYGDTLQALRALQRLNVEQSRLLLDDQSDGYYLVELLVTSLAPTMEAGSRAAAVGSGLLLGDASSPFERAEVLALARQLDQSVMQMQLSVDALERGGNAAPQAWAASKASVEDFSTQLREAFSPEKPELPAAALLAAAGAVNTQLTELHREAAAQLASTLNERITSSTTRMEVVAAIVAFGLALTAYLFAALYLTFMHSIGALQVSTRAIASGDLSTDLKVIGHDELAHIGRTVNGMNERLSTLVGEIRDSAARVNMAGSQVAEGSLKLSSRTEEQGNNLRESVVAISQLSSDVQNNAQAARDVDGLTETLSRQASDGTQAMGETLAAVHKLQDASRRVFEVVGVIDDVAFQTSMLSLNAAVEAARAGEAGKGFSIVASEVRSLAQRVGESADEIRALITLASDQLEFSGVKLASANQSLENLATGVQDVSSRLRQISTASTQQSDTLVMVAQRVGDLDQITRDNAQLVEESSVAAHSLVERAEVLRDAVASMRLRRGSADEARELLDRAWDHVARLGQEQGFKDLHDQAGAFIDRDLYVFALDRNGVYIACGAKPELIGRSVNSLPGIEGTTFVQDAWSAAEAAGGWVQYQIANPLTGEVTSKESYMRQLDDNLLLGCGVYRKTAPGDQKTKPRAAAWSPTQETREVVAF